MRKLAFISVLLLSLAGCASHPYGNFVKQPLESFNEGKLATDAVKEMAMLYPPAKTQLNFQQTTPDPFGKALIQKLRDKGYAVWEYAPKAKNQVSLPHFQGMPVHYVVDQFEGTELYRVTLEIGAQSLTRAYRIHHQTLMPAGDWVRKE